MPEKKEKWSDWIKKWYLAFFVTFGAILNFFESSEMPKKPRKQPLFINLRIREKLPIHLFCYPSAPLYYRNGI